MSGRDELSAWWSAVQRGPAEVPAGLRKVQGRLVRWVARGELADGTEVFVKAMGFPRLKDRLRYLLRPLPLLHEARMLRWLAAEGIAVPGVLLARGARRFGVPRTSMLVMPALPGEGAAPGPEAAGALLEALFRVGLYHRDLHLGNLMQLPDGRAAILDLQSARRRRAPLRPGLRRRMLTKLWADLSIRDLDAAAWHRALQEAGCYGPQEAEDLVAAATRLRQRDLFGRLRRCLQESTGFVVRRGPWRWSYRRRGAAPGDGTWVEGGRELFRYWLGDRVREHCDGQPPVLLACERPAPWWPGIWRVQVVDAEAFAQHQAELDAAHRRYQDLRHPQ